MIKTKGIETLGGMSEVLEKASGAELLELIDSIQAIKRILPEEGLNGRIDFIATMAETEARHRVKYGKTPPRKRY